MSDELILLQLCNLLVLNYNLSNINLLEAFIMIL